jgi:ABC-type bacteriocin/lantibiotic exporter with double-glycine peptidase domain
VIIITKKIKKTPTVLQTESVECGAAALGMILGHFGKYVSLEELRYECGVSRDGSNALNILKAAKNYGLKAKGLRVNLKSFQNQNFPVIIFLNISHFVVLEGIKNGIYYINDPAIGHRRCDEEEFTKIFSGIVLQFELTKDFDQNYFRKDPNIYLSRKEIITDNYIFSS